jgi:hypothetical protein
MIYPKKDQEYRHKAYRKTSQVKERKPAILYQVAPCNFPAVFKHDKFLVQKTRARHPALHIAERK